MCFDKTGQKYVLFSDCQSVRWKKFSSFGFAKGRSCVSGKTKCAKCAAGKKKLKMRVGKNFKNSRVGFECRLVGLRQVVKELSS